VTDDGKSKGQRRFERRLADRRNTVTYEEDVRRMQALGIREDRRKDVRRHADFDKRLRQALGDKPKERRVR
jgi:hypothetical protein